MFDDLIDQKRVSAARASYEAVIARREPAQKRSCLRTLLSRRNFGTNHEHRRFDGEK